MIRRGSKKGHYSPSFDQFIAFQHQGYRQNYIESELRVLKVNVVHNFSSNREFSQYNVKVQNYFLKWNNENVLSTKLLSVAKLGFEEKLELSNKEFSQYNVEIQNYFLKMK